MGQGLGSLAEDGDVGVLVITASAGAEFEWKASKGSFAWFFSVTTCGGRRIAASLRPNYVPIWNEAVRPYAIQNKMTGKLREPQLKHTACFSGTCRLVAVPCPLCARGQS